MYSGHQIQELGNQWGQSLKILVSNPDRHTFMQDRHCCFVSLHLQVFVFISTKSSHAYINVFWMFVCIVFFCCPSFHSELVLENTLFLTNCREVMLMPSVIPCNKVKLKLKDTPWSCGLFFPQLKASVHNYNKYVWSKLKFKNMKSLYKLQDSRPVLQYFVKQWTRHMTRGLDGTILMND